MSDTPELRIAAIPHTSAADPVQHAHDVRVAAAAAERAPRVETGQDEPADVAAATDGQLQNAYAQFVFDPHTGEVVVRIRDTATDRVLDELPSREMQALSRNLREYAEMLARRAAVQQAHNA